MEMKIKAIIFAMESSSGKYRDEKVKEIWNLMAKIGLGILCEFCFNCAFPVSAKELLIKTATSLKSTQGKENGQENPFVSGCLLATL